ncbi:Phage baseplate assembly protein W [Nitrosococcus oceani ATCC 19707]|uniref:Phage baseplate assembly protein W n=2 Tax=Nitrosococcus oceani TaxID=1229 RepID=Q3JA14_NITOC|nr:GPW/gp25 family protein [Nitrosococcus oceani]ABA58332.1 Phage baseplate assembly protein W [Nitrosococcus oceani ATCC 19707]EDZ67893.1 GPW / gp25 family [Nitrosococcus oceani AFC27]KFI19262.1 baseplate protein [Nitrosococcus oceani C-27]GEM18721.1 baseplate protein [Nitrosococcus oceani]
MNKRQADPTKSFLGIGWAFPPHIDLDGSVAEAVDEDDVRQAIRIILGTNPGERVMRPDFGAGLNAFVFEVVDITIKERLKKRVQEALIDWEPRIDVEDIKVTIDPAAHSTLLIDIHYRIRATNTLHNLVYPFYLQEGTPQ